MKIFEIIKYPLILLIFGLVIGCSTTKQIPVQTVEKVVVKDSVVYIKDCILVEVPVEKIVQVLPADTTSQIATSLAFSEAKIEKGILTHSLEQKGQIKAKIDTFYVTQIKEVEKYVDVPIEVIVEKKYTPSWVWWSLIFNIVITLLIAFRVYLKTKGI